MHRHQAKPSLRKLRAWTHCVAPTSCKPEAHGGVVYLDTCGCGAVRYTTINQNFTERSAWISPETKFVQGDL